MTIKIALPKLKPKLTEILYLLYHFRFLNRIHIQTLLHHKHHSRITTWLKELTDKGYIKQYYDKRFAGVPAVYSLGIEGRKYIKTHPKEFKDMTSRLLDRVWREDMFSSEFREHCLFIADIYLSLLALSQKTKAKLSFSTQTDIYGTKYLILPNPDVYFAITEPKGSIKRYFLDIFDDIPPKAMRNRVRQYFNYYQDGYWQDHTNKPFPTILLIFPNERLKKHIYYYIQRKCNTESEPQFYLSTHDQVKTKGLTRETLQKVERE